MPPHYQGTTFPQATVIAAEALYCAGHYALAKYMLYRSDVWELEEEPLFESAIPVKRGDTQWYNKAVNTYHYTFVIPSSHFSMWVRSVSAPKTGDPFPGKRLFFDHKIELRRMRV